MYKQRSNKPPNPIQHQYTVQSHIQQEFEIVPKSVIYTHTVSLTFIELLHHVMSSDSCEMWMRYLWVKGQSVCECAFTGWYYYSVFGNGNSCGIKVEKQKSEKERESE